MMNDALATLGESALQSMVSALKTKRLQSPYSRLQLVRLVPERQQDPVHHALVNLENAGFTAPQIVILLELMIKNRKQLQVQKPIVDLVTSGPEAPGIANRDTSVVVREMFSRAEKSVLVVGYAVYQGRRVFESLADRMDEIPDLDVQFFLNVARGDHDDTPAEIILSKFKERFKTSQWPENRRLPNVHFDPRSIDDESPVRSSLHAKCIVVDDHDVFVSSANFTEAGQQRNIEVGLHIESSDLAKQITTHFRKLNDRGLTKRAF